MLAQVIFNGFVTGTIIALPAVALTLTYAILKFPNFAIGAMLTMGAYAALMFNASLGLPLIWSVLLASGFLALVAVAIDQTVYVQLRDRTSITLLVASMGVSFVLENVARFIFGNSARSFEVPIARPSVVFGLRINNEQLVAMATSIVAMIAVFLILRFTPLGRAMRAVSDNPSLAAVRGISRERIICWTWAIAGVLIAVAGALAGLDRAIDPLIGWNYVVTIFAAVILGGLGNPVGAVIGAVILGVVEETSTLVLAPNYRQIVSFLAIALLLLLRPQGLLGTLKVKK
ncbi:MAG: branched-chain amino acid ABC transporter permease [Hyphomicrobium sp.]